MATELNSYASPTFSSKRMSRISKLEEWREKHHRPQHCKACSPPKMVVQQRLSIQSIAEKHARKHQVPQVIIPKNDMMNVSPLSNDPSSTYYGSSSEEEDDDDDAASGVLEEEEKPPSLAINLFPRRSVKSAESNEKENRVNSMQQQTSNRPRKSLLDRIGRSKTTATTSNNNNSSQRKQILSSLSKNKKKNPLKTNTVASQSPSMLVKINDPPVTRSKNDTTCTPNMAAEEDPTDVLTQQYADDNCFPDPDFDDILSEYDELVRSVYMETAAEAFSADEETDQNNVNYDTDDVPTSFIRFFQEFKVDECLLNISDDEENSLKVRRRRNMALYPLQQENASPDSTKLLSPESCSDALQLNSSSETSNVEVLQPQADETSVNEALQSQDVQSTSKTPDTSAASSAQSSPSFALPSRRRRCSVIAPTNLPPSSSIPETTEDSSSSSEESEADSCDSEDSEGQATVIVEREELMGGLPVHQGRAVLTAVPEHRAGLDVDMVEHRRLAMECHKLRDRLVVALSGNHDKSREFQRWKIDAPKLQQELIDARNEVQNLKKALRQHQS